MKNEKAEKGTSIQALENDAKKVFNIQERAFEFACRIVRLHQFLVKKGGTGRTLANQLLRSGTSVGANLEEAHAAQSKADFIAKASIALKEVREVHYWLRVLLSCELATAKQLGPITAESREVLAILTTIVKKARNSPKMA